MKVSLKLLGPAIITLSFFLIDSECQKNVTFYGDMDHVMSVEVEQCVPKIPEGFYTLLMGVNTHGNCVTLYKDGNCSGDFIVIPKSINKQQSFLFDLRFWETLANSTVTTTPRPRSMYFYSRRDLIQVESIGPCLDECDYRNIEDNLKEPVQLTVFDDFVYQGKNASLSLKPYTCVPLSTNMKRKVWSLRIESGEQACLELHKQADCNGEFLQMRKHSHARFFYSILTENDFALRRNNEVVAISLCGIRCKATDPVAKTEAPPQDLGESHVRIFDDANFLGYSKVLDLSQGCVNLTGEWEGNLISLQSNGFCIELFDNFGCNSTYSKSIQIGSDHKTYYATKLSKNVLDVPSSIRSLSLCGNQQDFPVHAETIKKLTVSYTHEMADMTLNNKSKKGDTETKPSSSVGFFFELFFTSLFILSVVSVGLAYLVLYFLKRRQHSRMGQNSLSRAQLFCSENEDV